MPGMDKTGPEGKGSMTGRKMGKCAGAEPGPQGFGRGGGMGRGRGQGFGRGMGWRTPIQDQVSELTKEEEKKILEARKKEIEERLNEIQ